VVVCHLFGLSNGGRIEFQKEKDMKQTGTEYLNKSLLIALGVLLFIPVAAHAVVGNVSIISGGEPVANATISFQTSSGDVVVEEESDDDGKAAILIPDKHKGKTLIVIVTKGDRTARRNVAIDQDTLIVSIVLPGALVVRNDFGFSLIATGLYKWGSFDGSHTYSSSTTGGGLNVNGAGLGVDLLLQPPSRLVGGRPVFFLLGFGLPANLDETGVPALLHGSSGSDSSLTLEENWFVRCMLAYEIAAIQQWQLALLGGLQFTDVKAKFTTDESSGSGVVNNFSSSKTMASPVLGLSANRPINNSSMQLVANWYMTWMGDVSGSGTSTLGNSYLFNVDGGIQTEFQFGIKIPLK